MPRFALPIRLLRRFGLSPQVTLLVLSDLVALLGTAIAVFLLRAAFGGVDADSYRWVLPLLMFGPVLGASLGLYQDISPPPQRELKSLFFLASLLYGIILAALFLSKSGDLYSRLVIMGSWVATVFTLPLARSFCKRSFARRPWWGKPLIILNTGESGRQLWRYLAAHPEHGLRPVASFDLDGDAESWRARLAEAARRYPDAAALLLSRPGLNSAVDYVTEVNLHFSRVLIVPDFDEGFRRYWLTPCDLGCMVGLVLRQNLHDRRRLRVKRGIDLLFCLCIFPLLLPLGLMLAALIRLDSPGPALYVQKRVGRHGRMVRIYKFRTMAANADALLQEYLARDPALREEWRRDQKLKHDPRVTRMGAFLRKTSLDELPQLLNVARGDMSLVGPRPIVEKEIAKYGPVYEEYCRVRPGVTGLWQISGRNNTTYAERVAYDHYYINNWSVWLDIWIIARTVPVVLTGYGAY